MVTLLINGKKRQMSSIDAAIEHIQMAEIFEDLKINDNVFVYIGENNLSEETLKEMMCLEMAMLEKTKQNTT